MPPGVMSTEGGGQNHRGKKTLKRHRPKEKPPTWGEDGLLKMGVGGSAKEGTEVEKRNFGGGKKKTIPESKKIHLKQEPQL